MYCSMTMSENDVGLLRLKSAEMNNTNTNLLTPPLPASSSAVVPVDVEALDIKPELLDLSDSRPHEAKPATKLQATKACQTEITICDEFWTVCIS